MELSKARIILSIRRMSVLVATRMRLLALSFALKVALVGNSTCRLFISCVALHTAPG
jgi:hypothetical protein